MTDTYRPLATVTLGSSASSVTFSSIPATYRDLILVINGEVTTNANVQMRLNADTGSNYSGVVMRYDGSAVNSGSGTYNTFYLSWSLTASGNRFLGITNIMDYSATDKHKTVLHRDTRTNPDPSLIPEAQAGRWANTSAITSMLLFLSSGNYAAGSTFSLYGIAS
jgi:hypothetical protein